MGPCVPLTFHTALTGLCAAVLLAGCAVTRPPGVICEGLGKADKMAFLPLPVAQVMTEFGAEQMLAQGLEEAGAADRVGPITLEVLTLSSGGQFGSFGAGFLRGWAENPVSPRPDFDLVTGVSAGSMLAPIAFAGPAFDAALDTYRGVSEAGVYVRKPLPLVPFGASLAEPLPLEMTLRRTLTAELIDQIAARHDQEGAQLLVSAVNIDTTQNRIFDLGEIAGANASFEARRDCMVAVLLASGAIPALMPPRHIDGALYADGGLRDHVFFQGVETARAKLARATGRPVIVEATIIVNGSFQGPTEAAEDSLPGYLGRSAEILADEVLRDSVTETIAFAQARSGWRVRGIFAETDISDCGAGSDSGTVNACVTQKLFDDGRRIASTAPIDWKTADELRATALEF